MGEGKGGFVARDRGGGKRIEKVTGEAGERG